MIAVLNYGSQFTHLIARRLRSLNVHAEVFSPEVTAAALKKAEPHGIILSGSPSSVNEPDAPGIDPGIFGLELPILGICYGEQLMVKTLGGRVAAGPSGQYGKELIKTTHDHELFTGLPPEHVVWFSHGDTVEELPAGFRAIAETTTCRNAAIADEQRRFFGLQFHPEVVHSEFGTSLLQNFALTVCHDPADWTVENARTVITERLRQEVTGDGHIVMAVSGGVDSTVAAAVLHQLFPDRLHAVFVDHGLLRQGEAAEVAAIMKAQGFQDFRTVDASELFLSRLTGVTDPEEKRKIIGHTFIEVFETEAKRLEKKVPVTYLAQGTIYPDRIESAQPSKHAAKIKSHHNVTLPDTMKLKVVEPLAELYKDEVRELGLQLELPEHLLSRHPFPGPGLAIRILGEVTPERLRKAREADAIFTQELRTSGLYGEIWETVTAVFPVKAVGVMGDARVYDEIICLKAITSVDVMTADWYKFPPEVLERVSTRIVNEVKGVTRVVYDVTQKPPGTVQYE